MKCDRYPDIGELDPPKGLKKEQVKQFDLETNVPRRKLYQAVSHLLTNSFGFSEELPDKLEDLKQAEISDDARAYLVAVLGLLSADGMRLDGEVAGPDDLAIKSREDLDPTTSGAQKSVIAVSRRFVRSLTAAVQEFQANKKLFTRVFSELARLGTEEPQDATKDPQRTVFARQFAEVSRRLIEQRVAAEDPQLRKRIDDALSLALGDKIDGRASAILLDLPDLDLDAGTAADIITDNVLAIAVVYYSAMLEEWKYFSVADKVAEQFTNGMLPITKGRSGDLIYEYIRSAPNRMTEFERRGLYARTLGLAQGSIEEAMPNREFADLWIRFLSATSLFNRQAVGAETMRVHQQQLFKTARDLGVNLSLHGYGMAHFAAAELQKLVKDVHAMFGAAELLSAYGVRDGNQLVDRVCTLYLNGAVNGVRQRTVANAGAKIIAWIASVAQSLSSPSTDATALFDKTLGTVQELIGNVERWLAVTGTPDTTVEQYSEPVAMNTQPTIPTIGLEALPRGFKDVMERAGLTNGVPAAPALPAM